MLFFQIIAQSASQCKLINYIITNKIHMYDKWNTYAYVKSGVYAVKYIRKDTDDTQTEEKWYQ